MQGLQPSAIREILKFTADPAVISFAGGNPAPEAFPVDKIREITDSILENDPVGALQYSVSEGYTPLRDWIKDDLYAKGCFNWNNDDVIITAGAQQCIEMAAKVICNEGDAIIRALSARLTRFDRIIQSSSVFRWTTRAWILSCSRTR